MTMPYGGAEEPDVTWEMEESVAPEVPSTGTRSGKSLGTEFGYWRTYVFPVGSGPQRIGNRSTRRKRLLIGVKPSQSSGSQATEIPEANPALGAAFVYTVPANTSQTLISAFYQLATSATVASRTMTITIADATGKTVYEAINATAVTASQTGSFSAAIGGTQVNSQFEASAGLPSNLTLQAGWTVTLSASSLQATDQIENIVLVVSGAGQSSLDGVFLMDQKAGSNLAASFALPQFQNGGLITIGDNFRYECLAELWAAPAASNTATVYLSVCDESYASDG